MKVLKKVLIPLSLIFLVAGVSIAITSEPASSQTETTEKKAVIVDQLNTTYPNQTFVGKAKTLSYLLLHSS